MDLSPATLRELAQYLRNSSRLFPNPRTRKAFEWLIIKASEAEDHAAAWDSDRRKLRAMREMYQEHLKIEESELDALLVDHVSAHEDSERD
jgi:hypothetical protein